jgi:hypothetical protein
VSDPNCFDPLTIEVEIEPLALVLDDLLFELIGH